MKKTDRNQLRRLQDKLVESADRLGLPGDYRIHCDVPSDVTIDNCRRFLYPGYEYEIRAAIRSMKGVER